MHVKKINVIEKINAHV